MRVVLDTNVLVSRLLSPAGTPARIFEAWEAQRFEVIVSEPILDEYQRVLRYDHLRTLHRMSDAEIDALLQRIRLAAEIVPVSGTLRVVKVDPDDRFVECAVEDHAEIIVSGNRHLLALVSYQGVQVLTPAAFLVLLVAQQ